LRLEQYLQGKIKRRWGQPGWEAHIMMKQRICGNGTQFFCQSRTTWRKAFDKQKEIPLKLKFKKKKAGRAHPRQSLCLFDSFVLPDTSNNDQKFVFLRLGFDFDLDFHFGSGIGRFIEAKT